MVDVKLTLIAGLGGTIGTMLRSVIAQAVPAWIPADGAFPTATLLVNTVGCFVLGFAGRTLGSKTSKWSQEIVYFVATGFCGGLTTMSSFVLETLKLLQNKHYGVAMLYLFVTQAVCFFVGWLGWYAASADSESGD